MGARRHYPGVTDGVAHGTRVEACQSTDTQVRLAVIARHHGNEVLEDLLNQDVQCGLAGRSRRLPLVRRVLPEHGTVTDTVGWYGVGGVGVFLADRRDDGFGFVNRNGNGVALELRSVNQHSDTTGSAIVS